ncbi:hypothetical protein [Colwellia psychrerythraea]|uniref:DUF642 domain-containing protein n=1 Tax=Colwellia psychrerythraea TaxID=28229 RepID=A0A099L3A4_COLPS|nr:hypothetical protein [Colwellia psychrerythraea]KGJ96925.1 hypothetical protein GAB14E_1393 [Colwellia psychrerythraea]
MLKKLTNIILSIALLLASSIASASLITNGSFEQVTFADNSTSQGIVHQTDLQNFARKKRGWDVFTTLPGWVTTAGNGIELQKNIVTKSTDGQQHVELDSHRRGASNTVMTQTLNSLTIGADYLLEFSYKPRTNKKNDNGINVFWYDAATNFDLDMTANFAINGRSKKNKNWTVQSILLTAQSETMALSFGAFGKQNGLGGLLDNISLVKVNNGLVTDIPEPSVFALSMLAFTLLVRRQHNKSK